MYHPPDFYQDIIKCYKSKFYSFIYFIYAQTISAQKTLLHQKNALQGAFSFHILFTALFHGSFHKTVEEGVGPVRAALEFRMGLGGSKVGMVF